MKNIKFRLSKPDLHMISEGPTPASRHVPEWFKNTPLRMLGEASDGIVDSGNGLSNNFTVKGCVPFLDAMTSGYTFVTSCDVEVSLFDNKTYQIRWLVDSYDPVSTHGEEQLGNMPRQSKFDHMAFKWENPWIVQTPPGYSTMFIHPINRDELPFRSFGGVVETDTYNLPVNFPFKITDHSQEKFIIEKNTPVIQAIPFKRDDWKSEFQVGDIKEFDKNYDLLKSTIVRSYRKMFWKKKRYL